MAAKRAAQKPRTGKDGTSSYKIGGIEVACDAGLQFDKPTPTPLFPVSCPTSFGVVISVI